MKSMIIIDIDEELLKKYDSFQLEYNLKGKLKDDNIYISIEYIENYPLILMNDDIKKDIRGLFDE